MKVVVKEGQPLREKVGSSRKSFAPGSILEVTDSRGQTLIDLGLVEKATAQAASKAPKAAKEPAAKKSAKKPAKKKRK